MLTRLRFRNFKAWREADLRFGQVTGLFGTNSAGKSSLLQLLLLLKQTRNATDRGLVLDLGGPGDMVNLGTFADIVHGHDERQRIDWVVDWTLPRPLKISDPEEAPARVLLEGNCLQARCAVGMRQASLWPHEMSRGASSYEKSWISEMEDDVPGDDRLLAERTGIDSRVSF